MCGRGNSWTRRAIGCARGAAGARQAGIQEEFHDHKHVRDAPGFWWALVTAILAIAVGLTLLLKAAAGIVSLTAVLTAFFFVESLFQTAAAVSYRNAIPNWGWLLASGVADLALAVIIVSGWPGTADWTLGLLAGVSLLTSGVAIVTMALSVRNLARSVKHAFQGR